MAGTRIFVLQMKDIIKTAVFAILGLALILLLVYLFVPKKQVQEGPAAGSGATYIPGTYSAEIYLNNSPIEVDVTVSDEEILMVELDGLDETQEAFFPLFEPVMDDISKEILEYQTTQLMPSTESPVTGQMILDAVETALDKARVDHKIQTAGIW
ncbi:MAG: hypothetical protein LBQ68_09145 [Clostridiales bacterium]|jgi:uncharacterized protein with FMN-binding domain|nr:hypothetical protein [Clostridiales bacterium]